MKIAIVIHFFHEDSIVEIQKVYSKALDLGINVYISVNPEKYFIVKSTFPKAKLGVFPNNGYDILPFLRLSHKFNLCKYDFVVKLHTKNLSKKYAQRMLKIYLERLCSHSFLNKSLHQFFEKNKDVGLISVLEYCRSLNSLMYGNRLKFTSLSKDYELYSRPKNDDIFFAGTMFAIRGEILQDVSTLINAFICSDIGHCETGSDGSVAHTLERFIPYYAQKKGYNYAIITPKFLHTNHQSHIIHQKYIWDIVPQELLHCGSNAISLKSETIKKYIPVNICRLIVSTTKRRHI